MSACIFVPRNTTEYDLACNIETHHVTLESYQLANLGRCSGEACAAVLVVYGAVSAASLVVSGSITVVGNVAYWAQRQVQCVPPAPARL